MVDQTPKDFYVRTAEQAIEKSAVRNRDMATVRLTPVNDILERENEVVYLRRELDVQRSASVSARFYYHFLLIMTRLGVTDELLRDYSEATPDQKAIRLANVVRSVPPALLQKNRSILTPFLSRGPTDSFFSEDGDEFANQSLKEGQITVVDYHREIDRSRAETVGLLAMQIEWLKKKAQAEKKAAHPKPQLKLQPKMKVKIVEPEVAEPEPEAESEIVPVLVSSVAQVIPQEVFALADWKIFWSKRYFSYDPNHLIPLPVTSRADLAKSVAEIGRGDFTIKSSSIVGAVEFYTRKDVIQKALSTRHKYAPDQIKDWVKIPRGKDRIHLYFPPDTDNQLVMFVAPRDVVYRGIYQS